MLYIYDQKQLTEWLKIANDLITEYMKKEDTDNKAVDCNKIITCCNAIFICLMNCYNTGSTLQTCDLLFILKQLEIIKEEVGGIKSE